MLLRNAQGALDMDPSFRIICRFFQIRIPCIKKQVKLCHQSMRNKSSMSVDHGHRPCNPAIETHTESSSIHNSSILAWAQHHSHEKTHQRQRTTSIMPRPSIRLTAETVSPPPYCLSDNQIHEHISAFLLLNFLLSPHAQQRNTPT